MSKNLTTLGKVADRVDLMSKNCLDRMVPVKDISFDGLKVVKIDGQPHELKTIAQRSMCYRLGTPYHYLRKCPPEIQQVNMNYWIEKEKKEELFLRFDGDSVRAIFTGKYKPVDNFEVIERLDSLGYGPDTKVQCHLDDEFMSLGIPDGNRTFSVNGDRITPGLTISNSEVGLASLSIAAFFLRLVCSNGLVSKTEVSASYRHVSTKILEEFPTVLERVSLELGARKDQFLMSLETPVENPEATLTRFNKEYQLGKEEQKAVEWGWMEEAADPVTMFQIVNAYTRASQFEGLPAEASHRLQTVGGNILGMLK